MSTKLIEEENTVYEIDEECMMQKESAEKNRIQEETTGNEMVRFQESCNSTARRGISRMCIVLLLLLCMK
ncbi:MAG: hypothetical protein UHS41_00115 [Lachnospiraceae bacterium]|nr:hypothetical protein [Lachnospiraceae bacterium]